MHCVNRAKYGTTHRIDKNGAEVGCDNKGVNERVLAACVKHILEYVQISKETIIEGLYNDIELIQSVDKPIDIEPLKAEIESYNRKKRKAIDLALRLISMLQPSKNVKLVRLVQSQPFSWITET